jgi:hypothetical protein
VAGDFRRLHRRLSARLIDRGEGRPTAYH